MTNSIRILECFESLVGWRESASSCYDALVAQLRASTSGQYVNDIPGMTIELVNEILPKDTPDVNDYLLNIMESQALELMNVWENMTKREVYTKTLLANNDMGVKVQNIRTTSEKFGRFVGWKIVPKESNSIRAEVLQFGGMFNTLQTGLTIYFYSSRQEQAIGVYTVDITKTNSQEWYTLTEVVSGSGSSSSAVDPITFICDYINRNSGHGQEYYVGYYEDDLTGKAILTELECGTCTGERSRDIDKYVHITPIEVPSGSTYVDKSLFDIDNVGTTNQTFGLFMKVNATCDASECVCDNKKMFAMAYKKMIAKKIFWDAWNCNETNAMTASRKEDFKMMADKLELELNGYVQEGRRIYGEIEKITIDLSQLDNYCLGMRKRALGVLQL